MRLQTREPSRGGTRRCRGGESQVKKKKSKQGAERGEREFLVQPNQRMAQEESASCGAGPVRGKPGIGNLQTKGKKKKPQKKIGFPPSAVKGVRPYWKSGRKKKIYFLQLWERRNDEHGNMS